MGRNPLWYKDAIIYELHVRCFSDSDGDGIGDFVGLTQKLAYLQDLGITAIWLLPFYPSPLKDDGYDIANYTDVHPLYGNLKDFRKFLSEAHRRGLKVITELVINHTSDQHPWFQRARKAPAGSRERDYYVWSDTPQKYQEARIIFQDFESSNWTWDPVAQSYYWHRFYSHQPDLNFDHPEVRKEVFRKLSFWLKMGVDGVRLDAVPYLFEREGSTCENLPETHAFLKELRAYVDDHFEERMILAEANQWPEDAAKYFGKGDECQMAFHFPIMPRLFMAIHLEDALPIIEIAGQTPEIPDNCQWALFLRNHDELTLEMVTDEERDYMFRVYAYDPQARVNLGIRRRLAPLLKNDRRRIELMNTLLFSLIGTPVLYYGDEIGMGDNIYLGDRDGVRTPMQWSNDRNAGFSKANPQRLYLPPIIDPEYHFETVNVEAQSNNPNSLLWWTKQLITQRKRFKAFGHGSTHFIKPENRKVLVFLREWKEELILIVANLSRFPQYVELDLSQYDGFHLVELFSGENFPKIGELPYFLTLGPYGYYWFALEKQPEESLALKLAHEQEKNVPEFALRRNSEDIFHEKATLENFLRNYFLRRSWFPHPLQAIDRTKSKILDHFNLGDLHLVVLELVLTNGVIGRYPLFISRLEGESAARCMRATPERVIVKFSGGGILMDVTEDEDVFHKLLELITLHGRCKGESGELVGIATVHEEEKLRFHPMGKEIEGRERRGRTLDFSTQKRLLKVFTLMEEGIDVDLELRLFFSKQKTFKDFLPLLGYLEYRLGKARLALAEELSIYPKEFSAKKLIVESAEHFFERVEAEKPRLHLPTKRWHDLALGTVPTHLQPLFENHLEVARHLGETTARFHLALSDAEEPDFSPLPFTLFYQRSLYQTLRRKILEAFAALRLAEPTLSDKLPIASLLGGEEKLLMRLQELPHHKLDAQRLRYHGRHTLDHFIYTGTHFLIADFEGNPHLTYSERRYKRSPLVDVASMLFSIAEASFEGVQRQHSRGVMSDQSKRTLHEWALLWSLWVGSSYFRSYLRTAHFLPDNREETDFLLSLFLIEHCVEKILEGKDSLETAVLLLHHQLPIYDSFRFS